MNWLTTTLIIALGLQAVFKFAAAWYAFRIARMRLTPTQPWVILGAMFFCMALRKIFLLAYVDKLSELGPLFTYGEIIIFNTIIAILAVFSTAIIYNLIKGKFK